MKRNGWKKLLATAGVMSLTVGCLSGCGGEPQGNPQTGSTQPGSQAQEQSQEQSQEAPGSAKVTFPLAEQVELTIATPDGAVASWQTIFLYGRRSRNAPTLKSTGM